MSFHVASLFLLVGVAAAPVAAQEADSTGVVEGHVLFESDGELRPLFSGGVQVVVGDPTYRWVEGRWEGGVFASAEPDSTGFFRMEAPAGRDTLAISSCYFDSSRRAIDIRAGDTTRVTIVTQPDSSFLAPRKYAPPDSVSSPSLLRGRDAAARALGLQALRETDLPEGSRELRLTVIGGYGQADNSMFVRIRENHSEATVDFVRFWPVNRDSVLGRTWVEWSRYTEAPRCDEIRSGLMEGNPRGRAARVVPGDDDSDTSRDFQTRPIFQSRHIEACRTRFEEQPDAHALLASLDSLGVMTLPDGASLPRGNCITMHGGILIVETLDDEGYRFSHYFGPHSDHPFLEESRRASAIISLLYSRIYPHLARVGGSGTFRGHVETSPRGTTFFRCGSAEPWIVEDSGRLGFRDSTYARLYVEGRGLLQPRGVFERYEGGADVRGYHPVISRPSDRANFGEGIREYPRRLYFRHDSPEDENVLIRQAQPGDCEAPPSIPWVEPIIPDEPG